jgi:uncharacterized protein (DUF58 family)
MRVKLDIGKSIQKLTITTKNLVSGDLVGGYRSVFRGTGSEFDGYRAYSYEDASLIDWKASARANKLLVKEYKEERSLNVFFLMDVSSSTLFGSIAKLKHEYIAELVASIAYSVLYENDNTGLVMFSDKIKKLIPMKSGPRQFYAILRELVNLGNYGGSYNLAETLKFVEGYLVKGSVLILVSDFIGLKGDFERYLKMCGSKFDMIAIMVRDPMDRTLPENVGQVVVASPYTKEKIIIQPDRIKEEYESYVKAEEDRLEGMLKNARIDFLKLSSDEVFSKPLIAFFKRRMARFH